jgi:hypothetical protein
MIDDVKPDSPPTSYAIARLIKGEPEALKDTAIGILQRSFFIFPGLYLAGVNPRKLVQASLIGSVSITASLILLYKLREKGLIRF